MSGDQEEERLSGLLSALAAQVVLADPADVPGLGKLLNSLEQVQQADEAGELRPVCDALRKLLERLVLGGAADAEQALKQVSAGTVLLQEIAEGKPKGKKARAKRVEAFLSELASAAVQPPSEAPPGATPDGFQGEAPAEAVPAELIDIDLYRSFVAEASEGLEQIEVKVLSLEESPDDKELLNAIFRTFHTLKGTSGFLNLGGIHSISHETETLLGQLREGTAHVSHEVVDFVLDTIDVVKGLVSSIMERLDAGLPPEGEVDLEGFAKRLAALGSEPSSLPLGEVLIQKGVVSAEDVAEALRLQGLQDSPGRLGEILVQEGKARARDVNQALREQRQLASEQAAPRTVRVDTIKLDNLVDMVGEMVITQSQIRQNPQLGEMADQKLTRDLSQLSRIVSELQRTAMSLRMVPIRQTLQKMIRLVRDLAKKSGKEVELLMQGEETEIDRNMVDEIYEPLIHLVRNAVDHGLEAPSLREEAGKPPCGKVLLRAYHKGGSIVIEVSDDGRGLDRERIVAKALDKGLIESGDHLDDHQVWNLIFEAGFSTAEKVSEVSGRGVGMDVVWRAIDKLRGKIDVQSLPGRGSTFAMRLPLTMAIIDGMEVRVGAERYIVPTTVVRESLRLEQGNYFTVAGQGEMVNIRGRLSPLVRLHRLFEVEPVCSDPYEGLVVVVEHEGRQKGLLVDELLGKQELVIKSLGEALKSVKGVAGGAILGDGRVGLIIDVGGLFELTESSERLLRAAGPAPAEGAAAIDVWDDGAGGPPVATA